MYESVARSRRSRKTLAETRDEQRKQAEQPNTNDNQRLFFRENGLVPDTQLQKQRNGNTETERLRPSPQDADWGGRMKLFVRHDGS